MCTYYGDSDGGSGGENAIGESFGDRMNKVAEKAHRTAIDRGL